MSQPSGPELTSVRSPRVKAARQLAKRAMRERARSFLAEGPQAVTEALARGGVVTPLFLTPAARAPHPGLAREASPPGAEGDTSDGGLLAGSAPTNPPHGGLR